MNRKDQDRESNFLLTKVRLSWYFVMFFVVALGLRVVLPHNDLDNLSIGIFSVSSFLFGFIITPILDGQRNRIEEIHTITRTEANALFTAMVIARPLPDHLSDQIKALLSTYLSSVIGGHTKKSEKAYEDLLNFLINYKGEYNEVVNAILEELVENQQNRTDYNMQIDNKVFSNEWIVLLALFIITLGFTVTINVDNNIILNMAVSMLSAALCMLIINLVKMSTLTHKKAKMVWEPFKNLLRSDFYQIDKV